MPDVGIKCRVLVVDDDDAMRQTLNYILKRTCEVTCVGSAEEALDILQTRPLEVMISDIRLPGMNGLELLELVRARWPSTRVIMMSIICDVAVAVEAMRLGAYFYMTKEFDLEAINALVLAAAAGLDDSTEVSALRKENISLRETLERLMKR